jgi:phosphate transport system substrate-binding protein
MLMKKTIFAISLLCGAASLLHAEKLVIKGSDTIGAKLAPMLAEEYKAQHPDISFEIAAEGSTTGITAIIDGTAQIGMASRSAKATEDSGAAAKGVTLKPTTIAFDGIGVIVNVGNPISSLTKKQIEQIFTGDITDWSAVGGKPGPISLYTRNTASGTYTEFKELAMSKRDYAGSSQKMAGNEQIAAEVGKNPNGVGYVGLAYLAADGIKAVGVDGAVPSVANVQAKKYPFARPLFYYTNGNPTGEAAKFMDFTLSPIGQQTVAKVGFVPVKPVK